MGEQASKDEFSLRRRELKREYIEYIEAGEQMAEVTLKISAALRKVFSQMTDAMHELLWRSSVQRPQKR